MVIVVNDTTCNMKLPALQIMKACPQHAEELGSSGLAMMMAICAQWDQLGCSRAVCWSNSRLGERCGLSRNSVAKVRQKLIDRGWLCYLPDGMKAGHYTPKLPEWYAQSSAAECANGVQLSVQTLCNRSAVDCAFTVQMRVTYKTYPIPSPIPNPIPKDIDDSDESPVHAHAEDSEHGFSDAWDQWGKIGTRKTALTKWKRMAQYDRALAIEAIPAWVAATTKDGTYPSRPHLSTWLNQSRWEDAPPMSRPTHQADQPDWVQSLRAGLCKIGPNNQAAWRTVLDDTFGGDVAALVAFAKGLTCERWPDTVQAEYLKRHPTAAYGDDVVIL